MKLMMMLGGLLGFGIGLTFGLAQESAWPAVIWRSSAAALCAGLLLRWWGKLWIKSLHEVRREGPKLSRPETNRAMGSSKL